MGLTTKNQVAIAVTTAAAIATCLGDGVAGANSYRVRMTLSAPKANTDDIYYGTERGMTLTALNGHFLSPGQQVIIDGAPIEPFIFLAESGTQSVIVSEYEKG